MNKERLLHIADVLESDRAQDHFAMRVYFSFRNAEFSKELNKTIPIGDEIEGSLERCGTTACIAGWTIAEFDPKYAGTTFGPHAALILDLDDDTWPKLFTATESMSIDDPKEAAKVVRHLAETGKVDWRLAEGYHGFDDETDEYEET